MEISSRYVYFIALIPFCIIWILIFYIRKDLRKEMLTMSLMIGILSLVTSYYWWTTDWWRPLNVTGTKVGIEDFIMGFSTGGIMASIYEVVFKRGLYKRKLHHHISGGLTILFLLAQTTMWLFWGVGFTSFWASTIAMTLVAFIMIFIRRDLFFTSIITGVLMVIVSSIFYYTIVFISPEWINHTYLLGLSGTRIIGVPIEEYIFWFFSGVVFGPFYEYWQGERLRLMR
jgi:hypothetical protein